MQNMIKQDREEHRAQLEDTVRRIFPYLGYSQEGMEQFIHMPDDDGDVEGEYYRIETEPGQGVLVKVRTGDRWYIPYMVPIDWESRYTAIWAALDCLKKACKERDTGDMWLHMRNNPPSHQSYYEGLLAMQGFEITPRTFMKAPVDVLDTLELPVLPDDIVEIEVSEDRLKEAAVSHNAAFTIYDKAPTPPEEIQKSVDETYEDFVGWFQNPDAVKTWVALEHKGNIIAICIGLRWRFDTRNLALHEVAVHPDYHGRRLGRYICIRCMQKLREVFGDSDTRFYLGTTLTQAPAITLYHKLGFTIDKLESYANYTPSKA